MKIWTKFKADFWKTLLAIILAFSISVLISSTSHSQKSFLTVAHIQTLNKQVSDSKANELVIHFNVVGHKNLIDPKILAAISFQESSFRYSIISGNDIGLFQLNYYWQVVRKNRIHEYSIEQLSEDWKLNTELAAEHIVDCRQRHPATSPFPNWICFHSPTYKYQKIYYSRIKKHLKKLEDIKHE